MKSCIALHDLNHGSGGVTERSVRRLASASRPRTSGILSASCESFRRRSEASMATGSRQFLHAIYLVSQAPMATQLQNGIMSLAIRIRSFSQGLLLRSLSFGPSLLPAPSSWPPFGLKLAMYTLYHVKSVGKLFLSISSAYEEHNHAHFCPSKRLDFSAPLSGSRRRSRRRSGLW